MHAYAGEAAVQATEEGRKEVRYDGAFFLCV